NLKQLSAVERELSDIYADHKWELARELKPKEIGAKSAYTNEHVFYREYFTRSLQPALDAWKEHLGPKFANAVKNGAKNTGMPDAFPENQLFVDIPGDGKFLVNNDPKVLDSVIRGAVRGFAKPTFERQGLPKPPKINVEASEPAKWKYLSRMADEAVDAHTNEDKDAALETIENLLGFTPLKELPTPGSRVEYQGQEYFTNGWDKSYQKSVNIVPVDTPGLEKWIKDGMPKLTTAEAAVMADRTRDAQEVAPLYLLKPVGKVKTIPANDKVGLARVIGSQGGFATPSMLGAEAAVKAAENIADAAKSVTQYLGEVKKATEIARDLQRGLETLDTAKQADILRGVQEMKVMKTAGMTKADDENLYHHLEDPEGVTLKGEQEKWLDDIILPIQKQNTAFYQELTDGGVPIEDYVHRV